MSRISTAIRLRAIRQRCRIIDVSLQKSKLNRKVACFTKLQIIRYRFALIFSKP